eukprot:scaffold46222_cov40-Cyclotella_meneghiniana.AAC.3
MNQPPPPDSKAQSNDNKSSKKKKSKQKVTTVDDLSNEELESIISGADEATATTKRDRKAKRASQKVEVEDASEELEDDGSATSEEDEASDITEVAVEEIELKQVPLPKGKESVKISTKTRSGDTTTTAGSTTAPEDDAIKGATFGNTADETQWADEIELSSDEREEPVNFDLKDAVPSTPATCATEDTSQTDLSAITDPSYIIPEGSNIHIVSTTMKLSANEKHFKTLIRKMKNVLDYLKSVSEDVTILARTTSASGTQLPPLTSSDDSHFPDSYSSIKRYFNVSQSYILEQDPIDAKTLDNRRKTKEYNYNKRKEGNKTSGKRAALKKKAKGFDFDHGPCDLWFTYSIMTKYPEVNDMLIGLNIDIGSEIGVKANLKNVQCFESRAKYLLTCVNGNLCDQGVRAILQHSLQREQKRLCLCGKLDTTVPEFLVYTKPIRPLKIPENERDELSIDPYPQYSRNAYHIEAAESAWDLLDPLLDEYAESCRIVNDFGPSAFLLENPPPGVPTSLNTVRIYHKIARISCAYNLRTTVMECRHVAHWFHPVKVGMLEVDELNPEDGKPTGRKIVPDRPYPRTCLAKELANITVNGVQVFHAMVINQTGPEVGVTNVVVSNDPECPYTPAIRQFAQNTLADLNCFLYNHLTKNMGYDSSTVQRLLNCCYISSAALAEESTWDCVLQKATPRYQDRRQAWLAKHSRLDYKTPSSGGLASGDGPTPKLGNSPIDLSDEVRKELVQKLKCDPKMTAADAMEDDGHASQHTGKPEKSINTLQTEGNEINQQRKQKDMAIQLSLQRRKVADKEKQAEEATKKMEAAVDDLAKFQEEATKKMEAAEAKADREFPALMAQVEYFKSMALAATAENGGQPPAVLPPEARVEEEKLWAMQKQTQQSMQELRNIINATKSDLHQRRGAPHHSGSGTPPSNQMEIEEKGAAGDK